MARGRSQEKTGVAAVAALIWMEWAEMPTLSKVFDRRTRLEATLQVIPETEYHETRGADRKKRLHATSQVIRYTEYHEVWVADR
jgi:hypothetical protein